MATKKLKYKDIFTEGMDLPENNDMGSATKPPKQDMGAGAGRGKQGGPTAKELSDYSRKQDQKKLDDTVFREGKEIPENNDMGPKKYAKGGMVSSASSRGDGMAVRGKTRGRLY